MEQPTEHPSAGAQPRPNPADPPVTPETTRRPRRRWLIWGLIIAGVAGTGLVAIAGFVGLGAFYVLTARDVTPTEEDAGLVLDIKSLATWMNFAPQAALGRVTKKRYFDGTFEIAYEYDDPDDEAPYLYYSIDVESTVSDAKFLYAPMWAASRFGSGLADVDGVSIEERNDLFRWGDESRFGILKSGPHSFGNLFVARRGTHVVYCTLSGVYFEDAESVRALLEPPLERLEAYSR